MNPDTLYRALGVSVEDLAPRAVLRADNTIEENEYRRGSDEQFGAEVDHLFGEKPSYVIIKKERPAHRMILWMTLQSSRVNEIAAALRMVPQTVRNVQKQPWFQDAFCRLSGEMGKDAVQTFLKAEVMPAILRTVSLAQSADSDAVKLAANKEILDRFLGKAVVKAEVKTSGQLDHVVYDAATLLEEQKRNAEILKGRGIGNN